MKFEWDSKKAQRNLKTHGISSDEACTVFGDTLSVTIDDPLHSGDEQRYIIIRLSSMKRLLVVVHTERGERIRIISARSATNKERLQYEENQR